jgi:predicted dehydrogenase
MEPIPIAFIGGSLGSAVGNTHRIAAEMDSRFKLVAGCFSRHEEQNIATGKSWGVHDSRIYSDWEGLLEGEIQKTNVLAILTPTPHHVEVLSRACSLGFSIICEKTLTTTVDSTSELLDQDSLNFGTIHAVYNYTGYPMVRELKALISRGELGEIIHCEISMPQEGFLRRNVNGSVMKPQDWRQSDQDIPTVSLDLGIHVVNLYRFVTTKRIARLVGSYQSRGNILNVVDHVSVIAECTEGTQVDLRFGKTSLGHSNGLSIACYGSKGSATWVQIEPEYLSISDTQGTKKLIHRGSSECQIAQESRYNRFKPGHPSGFIEAFANHYFDIAEDLKSSRKRSDYTFDQAEALIDMQVLQAISDSVSSASWVEVAL